jgi:hypothetical protein
MWPCRIYSNRLKVAAGGRVRIARFDQFVIRLRAEYGSEPISSHASARLIPSPVVI